MPLDPLMVRGLRGSWDRGAVIRDLLTHVACLEILSELFLRSLGDT